MRKLIITILFLLLALPAYGQEPIYLPLVLKGEAVAPEPILRVITQDGKIIDLLADWEISDPYWRPQIAKYKGDGNYVDSAIADGSRLVSKNYANVVESIPLTVRGTNQSQAIKRIRELLQVIRQAADYWTEPYEYDYAWLEVRPACNDCRTGYARIVKANIPELNNPYGQPFFSATNEAVMDDLTLIIEREPLWRGVQPGMIIGPLYNVAKNPDFELWNFGVTDSQPDSWNDLESAGITGQNSREDDSHSGEYSLKVRVSQSTATNRFKGVSQVIASTRANTEYTVVVWVRNSGVSNGVGRVLVTYSSQLEVYRSSSVHGWQLYTGTFTTGANDTVAINLEILTTAANTDGTVYFDGLMVLEGNWEQQAIENMLPGMTSSHIRNHWDQPGNAVIEAGDINWVDVWNVPGDESALVRLEVQNNTTPEDFTNPIEVFSNVRIGMRRTRDVQNFQNYRDLPGIADTTASSDDRIETPNLNNSWLDVGASIINGAGNVGDNQGRFRVFARVYDPKASGSPTLETRLNYFTGVAGINVKVLDSALASIRSNWTIVNLTPTASMIWDQKFSPTPLNQVGYTVQMKRGSGTDKGRLDYVLTMPTDGGYMEAAIEPALLEKNALVVDNTGSTLMVAALQKEAQWVKVYNVGSGYSVSRIFTDGTYLYVSASGGGNAIIHKIIPGQFTQTSDTGVVSGILGMEIYNSRFFYAQSESLFETDGVTFPGSNQLNIGSVPGETVFSVHLKSFNGVLYLSGRRVIPAPTQVRVWTWNGTSGTLINSFTEDDAEAFEVYANHLFMPTDDGIVREYDPDTNTWTQHTLLVGATNTYNGQVFNGKLYVGIATGVTAFIYVYDGSSWQPTGFSIASGGFPISLLTHDNLLYAQIADDTYVTSDGVTFTQLTSFTPELETVFNGLLVGSDSGDVYILSPEGTQYNVQNFQGSPFLAPPRTRTDERRHRYVFSYDRQNFINNLDDSALIGIGIVPMYLALIGDESN